MSDQAMQPAFVLHRRAYRESSLLVELLTRDAGRIGVVARGARRRRGSTPLEPFAELLVRWGGRGELGQLHAAERAGRSPGLAGAALYSGFYLNELLVRLLRRHDPHPEIYTGYAATLDALATTSADGVEALLRLFECRLLDACGYGMELCVEVDNGPSADRWQSVTTRAEASWCTDARCSRWPAANPAMRATCANSNRCYAPCSRRTSGRGRWRVARCFAMRAA